MKRETSTSYKIISSKEDAKKFYQELGKKVIQVDEPPPLEEVVDFWSKIWENYKSHNKNAEWIKKHEALHKDQQSQPWKAIDTEETKGKVKGITFI